jgi:hypothetical protein
VLPVEAYGDGALGYDDSANVVSHGDGRKLRAKEKLENVHGDEELIDDDEDCDLVKSLQHDHV